MIAELYEDWLFAGSPASGWRILVSNGVEYNITGFTVASRIITVSGSPSGTAIEIYLNRILGSTTSAKHFSWAGLGLYMTGQNKITGLRRRDKLQGFYTVGGVSASAGIGRFGETNTGITTTVSESGGAASSALGYNHKIYTDGTNGTPRTGAKTEIESATAMLYLYVGSYIP